MINDNEYLINDLTNESPLRSLIYELTYKNDYGIEDFLFQENNILIPTIENPKNIERSLWRLKIAEGIDLYFLESNHPQTIEIRKTDFSFPIILHYTIGGTVLFNEMSENINFKINSLNRTYHTLPLFANYLSQNNNPSVSLFINFKPDAFLSYLDLKIFSEQFIIKLKQKFIENENSILVFSDHISEFLKLFISQIQRMPFEKKFRKKFILLKFIELIWMGVYDLIEENESNIKSLHLTSQDFKKIHQSKDILLDNLENPPSLSALAKIVGLNEYKLKVGFKSVFGLPPYTLLQEHKLILAKKMLESGNQSVTEVAIKIGYSNFSKFSLAFKKKFGKNPSSIRKNT